METREKFNSRQLLKQVLPCTLYKTIGVTIAFIVSAICLPTHSTILIQAIQVWICLSRLLLAFIHIDKYWDVKDNFKTMLSKQSKRIIFYEYYEIKKLLNFR